MAPANLDVFAAANAAYAASFTEGGLPMPPARKVAVVACMDARLHPEKALGIALGDSHVIRNAGGLGADSLRSLVISQQLLGTEEIYIVHHTDCGMLTFTNDVIHGVIQKNLGQDASKIDYLPFPDLDQSVIDDVNAVAASKLIKPGTPITGYVYDVNTGLVKVVATAETPVA